MCYYASSWHTHAHCKDGENVTTLMLSCPHVVIYNKCGCSSTRSEFLTSTFLLLLYLKIPNPADRFSFLNRFALRVVVLRNSTWSWRRSWSVTRSLSSVKMKRIWSGHYDKIVVRLSPSRCPSCYSLSSGANMRTWPRLGSISIVMGCYWGYNDIKSALVSRF